MSDRSSHNKRIAKNTLFLYLRMGLVLVVSLFSTRVVLQALDIEDYGINNVVSGFVTMFAFLNTSMSNGVQRFYNFSLGRKNGYSIKDVYNTALQIQAILAVTLLVPLETFGMWYIHTQMVIPIDRFAAAQWVFQFSVLSLVLLVLQIPYSAAIMAYEKMDYYAYLSIFDVLAKLGIAYIIKYTTFDKLILYGALNMLVSLICFFLYYGYAKSHFQDLKSDFIIRKQLFKPMLYFSGWNGFGSFAYMIKSQGLNMLLNVFFGPVVNAARGVSNMAMSAIQGFQSNIVIAFRPQLIQSYATGDNERVLKLFYNLSKVSFILLAMLSIPVIIEIEYILHLWLGDTIPDYTDSYTVKKGDLFYKARIFENNRHRTYNEMFHISLNNRGIVRTQRYSFPGYPCLYLGSTIYSCWEEMDQPKFDDMMVSQFTASRDFLLFDLRKPNQLDFEQNLEKTLVRLPMVIACSLRVKHQKDNYKPEYIIPQLLIEYIIEQNRNLYNNEGKDLCELQIGVIYTSSRINNDMEFPKRVFDNIAIPVFNTDGEYCQVLASCFSWTDPTCYEYENLKKRFEPRIFHIDNDREEENYKCSKMGELEERLSSFEKKAFLHSVFTRTSIVLNQSGDPEDNGILCNTQYTIT